MKKLGLLVVAFVGLSMLLSIGASAEEKPKYSVKDVMKVCMKGGLCKKVATGKASDEEKEKLVAMFTAMAEAKPKKGSADSWKAKTTALVKAAKGVAAGEDGAGKKLVMAANCKACHSMHK